MLQTSLFSLQYYQFVSKIMSLVTTTTIFVTNIIILVDIAGAIVTFNTFQIQRLEISLSLKDIL